MKDRKAKDSSRNIMIYSGFLVKRNIESHWLGRTEICK